VKLAVVGLVAVAADGVQVGEELGDALEFFESLQVLGLDVIGRAGERGAVGLPQAGAAERPGPFVRGRGRLRGVFVGLLLRGQADRIQGHGDDDASEAPRAQVKILLELLRYHDSNVHAERDWVNPPKVILLLASFISIDLIAKFEL